MRKICSNPHCGVEVTSIQFACADCWASLPKEVRLEITTSYAELQRSHTEVAVVRYRTAVEVARQCFTKHSENKYGRRYRTSHY